MSENETATSAQELEEIKKMFSDYQKKENSNKRKTSEEILAKFFVPRKTKETFRILPRKENTKYVLPGIEEAHFHVLPTNGQGGKLKRGTIIYCQAHNDPKVPKMVNGEPALDPNGRQIMVAPNCPACNKYCELINKQDRTLKGIKKEQMTPAQLKIKEKNDAIYKEAIGWQAKKFYIARGIDQGKISDGVKFWRFKYNFKQNGAFDKLYPILSDYATQYKTSWTNPVNGCDLNITSADSEFNGFVYKQITAISTKQTPLHHDPMVAEQWLEDDITWRDVFLPKKAPHITPEQYLELVVEGNSPYWDDSDPSNKHWVFPNHPDLELAANTRTFAEDANNEDTNDDDDDYLENNSPSISNINASNVNMGTPDKDAIDVGEEIAKEATKSKPLVIDKSNGSVAPESYDDLPF